MEAEPPGGKSRFKSKCAVEGDFVSCLHARERVTGDCKSSAVPPISELPATWEHGLVSCSCLFGLSAISLSVVSPDGRQCTRVLAPKFCLAVSESVQIRWG